MTQPSTHKYILEASGLDCIRNDQLLFHDLGFMLEPGQALLLAGRNGSGKTSLLRMLCGIRLPDAGEITWNDTDIYQLRSDYHQHTHYIGHRDGIKHDLTPLENLAMARALGRPGKIELETALEKVGLLDVEGMATRYLSAGQQRRLALAGLLVTDAALWILDEPFTSLDKHGIGIIEELLAAHTGSGGMLAMTSHHPVNLGNTAVHHIDLSS